MFETNNQRTSHNTMIRFIGLGLLLTQVTGCAIFKSDFSCTRVGGANGCISMDQIYSEVQNGEIKADKNPYDGKQKTKKKTEAKNHASAQSSHSNTSVGKGYRASIPEAGEPVRFAENIQKLWIFPFEDTHGNYHETSIVYAVLTSSHWIAQPVSSIQALGEGA